MKEIININFVSNDAPNILLIACINNVFQKGYYLKHFKSTHNIYALTHNTDNNFAYYYDLPSKHTEIITELNKHNLYKFSISSLSFGGFMAFYLIFHMPDRVEKAFVFDFYYKSIHASCNNDLYLPKATLKNWTLPKKILIPIILFLTSSSKDFHKQYIKTVYIKELIKLFNNIRFILINSPHKISYKIEEKFFYNRLIKKAIFLLNNGFSLKYFWNKLFPKWIYNKYLFKNNNKQIIKIFTTKHFN